MIGTSYKIMSFGNLTAIWCAFYVLPVVLYSYPLFSSLLYSEFIVYCSLFADAFLETDYIASNERMIGEL
jgi:hypothetical protein